MTKNAPSTPEPITFSPPNQAHPPPPAEEVRSLIEGQSVAKDVLLKPRRERERERKRGNSLPKLSPFKHIRVPNKPGISGGFLLSNKRTSGSIIERRISLFTRGETVPAFISLERTETNIAMNKCKDTSNSEG